MTTLTEIQQEYKSYKRLIYLFIPFLVLIGLTVFWNRYVTLALLALATAFQLFYIRKRQKTYVAHYNEVNIESTTAKKINASFQHEDGGTITNAVINKANLLPLLPNERATIMRYGLTGSAKGLEVAVCDVSLPSSFKLVKNGKNRIHFNTGSWLHFPIENPTGQNWRYHDPNAIPTPIRIDYYKQYPQLEAISLADHGYQDAILYHPQYDPDQIPTEDILLQIEKLRDYTTGAIAISVQDHSIDVFIRNRFLAAPVSLANAPNKEQIELDPLPELERVLKLIKAILK